MKYLNKNIKPVSIFRFARPSELEAGKLHRYHLPFPCAIFSHALMESKLELLSDCELDISWAVDNKRGVILALSAFFHTSCNSFSIRPRSKALRKFVTISPSLRFWVSLLVTRLPLFIWVMVGTNPARAAANFNESLPSVSGSWKNPALFTNSMSDCLFAASFFVSLVRVRGVRIVRGVRMVRVAIPS